jgi:hypothetical protein
MPKGFPPNNFSSSESFGWEENARLIGQVFEERRAGPSRDLGFRRRYPGGHDPA